MSKSVSDTIVLCTLSGIGSFTISGIIRRDAPPSLVFTASASSSEPDANYADNRTEITVAVDPPLYPDLAASISASPSPAAYGSTLKYQFTVTNVGAGDSTDPAPVRITMPAEVTVVRSAPGCFQVTGLWECSAHPVRAGESSTFSFDTRVDATSGVLTSKMEAALYSSGDNNVDNNHANDSASNSIPVAASPGQIQFSDPVVSFAENIGSASVTVTRTNGTGATQVAYATTNGTATASSDYTPQNGTVMFAADEKSKTIQIPIIDDAAYEGDESLTVTLLNPTNGATLGVPATASIKIVENDAPPAMAGQWAFDEPSGTIAADALGHHNGTVSNNPSRVPGARGGLALRFDGSQLVVINASGSLVPTSAFTVTAWVNPDAFAGGWGGAGYIISNGRDCCGWAGGGVGLHLMTNQAPRGYFYRPDNTAAEVGGTAMTPNQWHHLAMVFDGTSLRIYQDGTQTGQTTFPATTLKPGTYDLRIGQHVLGNYPYPFHGAIDDVRIYNGALSATAVSELAR